MWGVKTTVHFVGSWRRSSDDAYILADDPAGFLHVALQQGVRTEGGKKVNTDLLHVTCNYVFGTRLRRLPDMQHCVMDTSLTDIVTSSTTLSWRSSWLFAKGGKTQ